MRSSAPAYKSTRQLDILSNLGSSFVDRSKDLRSRSTLPNKFVANNFASSNALVSNKNALNQPITSLKMGGRSVSHFDQFSSGS